MSSKSFLRMLAAHSIGIASSVILCTAASANEPTRTPSPEGKMIVRSDRPVGIPAGRSSRGWPVVQVENTYHVRFADLDLTTREGIDALDKRVRDAVKTGCKNSQVAYPYSRPDAACVTDAMKEAKSRVDEAISEAKNRRLNKTRTFASS
jgi:UrcA family protein